MAFKKRIRLISILITIFLLNCGDNISENRQNSISDHMQPEISESSLSDDLNSIPEFIGDRWDEGFHEDEMPLWSLEEIESYLQNADPARREIIPAPQDAPNIVVVIADDLPRGLLGFEGNRRISTPNLDRLRGNGIYFDRFYLPLGQCAPSRAVLWTSLYPTDSGVETNGDRFHTSDTTVFPEWLGRHGYRTGFFGKCHIGTSNPGSLDRDWHFDSVFHTDGASRETPNTQDLYDFQVYLRKNAEPAVPGVFYTRMITERAIDFVQNPDDKPFFLWLAHRAPHPSTLADTGPNGEWDSAPPGAPRYRVEDMPSVLHSAKANDNLNGKPPQQRSSPSRFVHNVLAEKPNGLREHLRRAHEQVDYMDQQVGNLMNALDAAGKLDNTIFVFVSDNGAFFGERSMAVKGPFLYDEMVRVPLLISWPARLGQGETRDALVQSSDLAQTLLDAAGLPAMPDTSGQSFWSVAEGQNASHRKSVFFQYHSQKNVISKVRGVLKDQYKLSHHLATEYFSAPHIDAQQVPLVPMSPFTWELYDMQNDPNELNNLLPYVEGGGSAMATALSDPNRRPQLNNLLRTLAEYQTESNDGEGLRLVATEVRRTDEQRAELRWRSVKSKSGAEVRSTTEVIYRALGCQACPVFEVDHKLYRTLHTVTLEGLDPGQDYEALLFSFTASTNGGVARFIIPAAVGAEGLRSNSIDLDYRKNSYMTDVLDASGPEPPRSALCEVIGGSGAILVERVTEIGGCNDECRLTQDHPNRSCAWDGAKFREPSQALCRVVGGAGAVHHEGPLSRADCDHRCAEITASNPNSSCSWQGDVFREHPAALCQVIGGAQTVLLSEPMSSDECNQRCDVLLQNHPNASCSFGGNTLRHHPTEICAIDGGCGAPLMSELLTRNACFQACDARESLNPGRICRWGGETLRDRPISRCSIIGGGGAHLHISDANRCSCAQECEARANSNPNRTCLWGGENLR